ncbi:MAG: cyclic nucleotide-binding domain-containing protein [Nitrospinae bacterium]|nr:cyclic nucleotide-binding domain-containing protein [Nitrospinota bacterium]
MTDEASAPRKVTKLELLESAPHFSYFEYEEKQRLVPYLTAHKFMPGDFLITEGEAMSVAYFILSGRVEVLKGNVDGDRRRLAELGGGQIVGEGALIPFGQHASTVLIRTREKVIALGLAAEKFADLTINDPQLAYKILYDIIRLLRQRLNEVSNRLADTIAD